VITDTILAVSISRGILEAVGAKVVALQSKQEEDLFDGRP
jgi:hypothetical protein